MWKREEQIQTIQMDALKRTFCFFATFARVDREKTLDNNHDSWIYSKSYFFILQYT